MIFKKNSGIIILSAVMVSIIALILINSQYKTTIINTPLFQHTNPPASSTPSLAKEADEESPQSKILNLKSSIVLPVPFTPQAPTGNWDELHNEACEEAGAIMAYWYFYSDTVAALSPKLVEKEIEKLTNWQQKTFGYYLSVSSQEIARMIKEVYGLNTEIKTDYTEADIKKALAEGKLILFPANGRLLGNPYYKRPGPIYHMLVIKGYNEQEFITNDPGTKRGLNYPYTFEVLYNANGNWDHAKKSVKLDEKNIIIVWK